jgi:HK97 family phage major capsid protein
MSFADQLSRARREHAAAVARLDDFDAQIQALPANTPLPTVQRFSRRLKHFTEKVAGARDECERVTAVSNARQALPPQQDDFAYPKGKPMDTETDRFEGWSAVARGALRSESTYRPPDGGGPRPSFLRDLFTASQGDQDARERLWRNDREAAEVYSRNGEQRDMGDVAGSGGQFVPPLYLADLWVRPSISRRPLADALPRLPLPPTGTAISIPHLSGGVAVAARASGGTVTESDGTTATITHDVNEISGLVDVDRIAVMRSDPTLDTVIGQTLQRRHDAYLDAQLISGTGTAPQHRGILNVVGINAVTYTAATPTAAGLLSKIADAIQQIATDRAGEVFADLIVLHPRRGAWMATNLSATFPLFQLGQLNQAGGTQSQGFVDGIMGLKVVLDAQVPTTLGAGTNEDRIIVLASDDYLLLEGPMYARTFTDVGSGTGAIRFDVFSHTAFLSKRYPDSAAVVSGTGLVSPVF